jgi:hypothetical protein
MHIIFTLNAHFAEYTTNKGTDEEPDYGEVSDVTTIIDGQPFETEKEILEHIKTLAERYDLDEEDIGYMAVQRVRMFRGKLKAIH